MSAGASFRTLHFRLPLRAPPRLFIIHHSSFIIHFPHRNKKGGRQAPALRRPLRHLWCHLSRSERLNGSSRRRPLRAVPNYSLFIIHYSFTRQRISPTDCTIILHSAFRILHLCHRHIGAHYIHFRIFSIADFSRRETCA